MSLSEKMTGLMNAVRSVTGGDSKLSVDDATKKLNQISGFRDNGIITTGSANDLQETGMYATHGALDNLPEHGPWGVLTVYAPAGGSDYVKQVWSSVNDNATYTRIKDANGFKTWLKLGGAIRSSLSVLLGGVQHEYC